MAAAAGIAATGAFAAESVEYFDPVGGTNAICSAYTEYAGQTDLSTGWYVVSGAITNGTRITVNGDVNLILRDNSELVATKGIEVAFVGIITKSLTIWAQGANSVAGRLTATTDDEYCAGIGGGTSQRAGGTVTINGGVVTAQGGSAGIGGGESGAGGTVTINGGEVTATGNFGAGIGGGALGAGGTVTINGGVVTAQGGSAGIGGGYEGAGGTVTINGGVVTATGHSCSAGIGGGQKGAGGTVTIKGGVVMATGEYSASIGAGILHSDNGSLDISGMKVGRVNGNSVDWVLPSERESLCRNADLTTVRIEVCQHHDGDHGLCDYCGPVTYYDHVGRTNAICSAYTQYTNQTELSSGWYVVTGVITSDSRITVRGDINLILRDNSELAAMEGVNVAGGNSLTIWAQSTNAVAGKLTATGGYGAAGIGGGSGGAGGTVTINGGTVTATGGWGAAAIGAGNGGSDNGSLVIDFDMKVGRVNGDSVDWVLSYERESLCRITDETTVRIEVCHHHDGDQNGFCDYCGPIPYYDPVGGTNATSLVCSPYAGQTELPTGWYVVSGVITNGTRITVNGDVNLVLRDNSELAAMEGVNVAGGNSLTIWAQSTNSVAGRLTATGVWGGAGIGGSPYGSGGTVTINGGTVTATGGQCGAGIGGGEGAGGGAAINGGSVAAGGGGGGGGIGGGDDGAGGTVTINGGTVTATGSQYGAGIGGGDDGAGGTVTINGGMVTATSNNGAAGIGGGAYGAGGSVTINGGAVTATSDVYGAGIGGGWNGAGGAVTINGGVVTTTGGEGGAAIGAGKDASGNGSLVIPGMKVGRVDGDSVDWIFSYEREGLCRNTGGATVRIEVCPDHHDGDQNSFCDYCGRLCGPVPHYDPVGRTNAICSAYTQYTNQTELSAGWYVVPGVITNGARITVSGDVNLILCDNSELAATNGIQVTEGNNLAIWAQSTNSVAGKLTATTDDKDCAGIGGDRNRAGGNVTINGGVVTATGGYYGAGIGGGAYGAGGSVTINGGEVTATGDYSAGIGGGRNGVGGSVTINGGEVTATSNNGAAGIGGGAYGAGGSVTINGGAVTATGGQCGAGIGGGVYGAGGGVTINGGTVTVTGGEDGDGIGLDGGAAIGAGADCPVDGSLMIASYMKVGYVEDGAVTWAGADERETYCRNTDGKAVRIASAGVVVDAGGGKTVLVPMTWIESVVPESFAGALEEYVYNDAANGRKVWECYVLGLDPKELADFRITSFPMNADGTPDLAKIAFSPSKEDWNLVGAEPVLEGRSGLGADSEWVTVTDVGDPTSLRFFRIRVALP